MLAALSCFSQGNIPFLMIERLSASLLKWFSSLAHEKFNLMFKQTNKNPSESTSEPSGKMTCHTQNPGVCFHGFGRPDAPRN